MAAGSFDITVEQGDTFSLGMTFNDATPSPIDVSGWTFTGQIRSKYDASNIIASFTFTDGLSSNIKNATIPASQTLSIPVDPASNFKKKTTHYVYDIQAVRGDGTTIRVLEGTANISPLVTK